MKDTPHIFDLENTHFRQKAFKIHFVQHTLDIRHTHLKGSVHILSAKEGIYLFCVLKRNEAFTVKLRDFNIRKCLNAGVFAHSVVGAVIFHSDNIGI